MTINFTEINIYEKIIMFLQINVFNLNLEHSYNEIEIIVHQFISYYT